MTQSMTHSDPTPHLDAEAAIKRVVDPLTRATASTLAPINLHPSDRLSVSHVRESKGGSTKGSAQLHDYFVLQAYTPYPDGGHGPASYDASTRFLSRFPCSKSLGHGRSRVDATDFSSLLIHSLWPYEQVDFSDEAKVIHDYNVLRFFSQTTVARTRAAFKVDGTVPPSDSLVFRKDKPLGGHQVVAALTSCGQVASSLFMEQGTGKTYPTICRIETDALALQKKLEAADEPKRTYKVLIVCPKNVRTNWVYEFRSFSSLQHRVNQVRGPKLKRADAIVDAMQMDDGDVYSAAVCSYETIENTWEFISLIEWDLVVLDESHYIKSPRANRTAQALKLRDISHARMELTGTPVANGIQDLFTQLEFLDEGMSGFCSFEDFKAFHCKYDTSKQSQDGVRRVVGFKNVPLLQERLARVSFILTSEEAKLDLPELTYDIIEVLMTPKQRKIYTDLQKKLIAEIESSLENDEARRTISTSHILTKLLRLAQVTSGHVRFDGDVGPDGEYERGAVEQIDSKNPKVEALVEILQEMKPKEKMVVWACFSPDIEVICARLHELGIGYRSFYGGTKDRDRDEAVAAFNGDPSVRVFIANPLAGGTGLNLLGYPPGSDGTAEDTGCNVTRNVYFSQGWSMTARSQSEKRSHRRGTRVPVRCTDLVVPSTIDEEIRCRVVEKRLTASDVQDVRDVMTRLLKNVATLDDDD